MYYLVNPEIINNKAVCQKGYATCESRIVTEYPSSLVVMLQEQKKDICCSVSLVEAGYILRCQASCQYLICFFYVL
jgi:hypothetical protein